MSKILFYNYDNHTNDKTKLIKSIKKNIFRQNSIYYKGDNLPKTTSYYLNFKKINVIDKFLEWLINYKINYY